MIYQLGVRRLPTGIRRRACFSMLSMYRKSCVLAFCTSTWIDASNRKTLKEKMHLSERYFRQKCIKRKLFECKIASFSKVDQSTCTVLVGLCGISSCSLRNSGHEEGISSCPCMFGVYLALPISTVPGQTAWGSSSPCRFDAPAPGRLPSTKSESYMWGCRLFPRPFGGLSCKPGTACLCDPNIFWRNCLGKNAFCSPTI